MTKVWRLLSILIIPLMCLGLVLVPAAVPGQEQVALASGNVTVAINPSPKDVLPGANFTIDAVINNPADPYTAELVCAWTDDNSREGSGIASA